MNTNCFLSNENLCLRPTTLSDFDLNYVLSVEHNKDNALYLIPWTKEEHSYLIQQTHIRHMIIQTHQNEPVGYIIMAGIDNPNRSLELRRIAIEKKGSGYGRQVLQIIKKWAFLSQKSHRLWLDVKDFNTRARHLYSSEGFVTEAILRDCIKTGDHYESLVLMSILEYEYFS